MTTRPNQPLPEYFSDLVENLMGTLQDGRKGFRQAAEQLRDDGHDELAAEMEELSQQRERLIRELRTETRVRAVFEQDSGSTAGALHRGWMTLKDALTGGDPHAILAAAERGEDRAKGEYQKALRESLPDDLQEIVVRQAAEIETAHDRVKALRDQHAG